MGRESERRCCCVARCARRADAAADGAASLERGETAPFLWKQTFESHLCLAVCRLFVAQAFRHASKPVLPKPAELPTTHDGCRDLAGRARGRATGRRRAHEPRHPRRRQGLVRVFVGCLALSPARARARERWGDSKTNGPVRDLSACARLARARTHARISRPQGPDRCLLLVLRPTSGTLDPHNDDARAAESRGGGERRALSLSARGGGVDGASRAMWFVPPPPT